MSASTSAPPNSVWPLALQVGGALGPPLQSWTVQAQPGQVWSTTLWLPVSANFVLLRGPTEMESAIGRRHHHLVDAGARPIVPAVVSVTSRDANSCPRRSRSGCFWVPGNRTVQFTGPAPVLRIHSGGKANLATFTTWNGEYSRRSSGGSGSCHGQRQRDSAHRRGGDRLLSEGPRFLSQPMHTVPRILGRAVRLREVTAAEATTAAPLADLRREYQPGLLRKRTCTWHFSFSNSRCALARR